MEVRFAEIAEAHQLLGDQTDWMPDLVALAVERRGRPSEPGLSPADDLS